MKISGWHKDNGDDTELLTAYSMIDRYDKVYISKVFLDTKVPDDVVKKDNVEFGGTGFFYDKSPALPDEIEHHMPDYHLYDNWVATKISCGSKLREFSYYTDYSIGFTTRGCIRQCSFCVNRNYKKCSIHSRIGEFLDKNRPYICLLDDNVFACQKWRDVFDELNGTGKRFQYKQGLDERLLTDEKCEILFKSRWIGDYIFAFDNIRDKRLITEKLKLMRNYTKKVPKFYTFCAYNHESPHVYNETFWTADIADLFERISILSNHHCLPYVMRYKDYAMSPYRGIYVTIARWCNQPSMFKKMSFREFCAANGETSSAYKYMLEFENTCPEIARKYYDRKWL